MAAKNAHAVALGRKGGSVKSEAKADAARRNGAKGGRPRSIKPPVIQALRTSRLAAPSQSRHTSGTLRLSTARPIRKGF